MTIDPAPHEAARAPAARTAPYRAPRDEALDLVEVGGGGGATVARLLPVLVAAVLAVRVVRRRRR